MFFRILLLPLTASILFLMASCGGSTTTSTLYEPPGTPGGRLCINQCRGANDFCHKDCELEQRKCTNEKQAKAIKDYEAYARERFSAKAPLELQPRDFEQPETCSPSSCYKRCENTYKTCYESCGGKVSVSSSCRFLCFN